MSQDYPVPDLYCNESADDVLSSDANISVQSFHENLDSLSDEESSIVFAFDSEVNQFLDCSELKRRFCNNSGSVTSRIEVVNWMLKVVDSFGMQIFFFCFRSFFYVYFFPFLRFMLTTNLCLKLHIFLSTIWTVFFCLVNCR